MLCEVSSIDTKLKDVSRSQDYDLMLSLDFIELVILVSPCAIKCRLRNIIAVKWNLKTNE